MLSEVCSNIVDQVLAECEAPNGQRRAGFCLYRSMVPGTVSNRSKVDSIPMDSHNANDAKKAYHDARFVGERAGKTILRQGQ